MTKTERQTAYQTAAHAAALKAAKDLVAKLEAEGPATGWGQDNQALAVQILEAAGNHDDAFCVGGELNRIAHG